MRQVLFGVLFCSVSAFGGGVNAKGDNPKVSMPEPSSIAELAVCATGVAMWVRRRR